MKFDLSSLIDKVKEEVNENSSSNRESGSKYPIVYPGENGKLTVRILYNPKMNGVQRKVFRHDSGKGKVACLKAYGEDCPVCNTIDSIEKSLGKESGAFRKYGYKTRGICFAMIVDHDSAYFKGDNDPKKGDIVLLMYPKTVYDKINNILIDAGEHIYDIVSENEGIPLVIERQQKGNAFPSYEASLFPYGKKKAFEDDSSGTGEEKFDNMLQELPNLSEELVPSNPSDDIRTACRALAESINQEYIGNNVVNPGDEVEVDNASESNNGVSNVGNVSRTTVYSTPLSDNVAEVSNSSGSVPDCFGNHDDKDNKCLLCPYEPDCFMQNN